MDLNDRLGQFFEDYQRRRDDLAQTERKMAEISVSATSKRREVTITVGQGGIITDFQFPTSAYKRMTPADLASAILSTYQEARDGALDKAAELMTPLMPEGVDVRAMLGGAGAGDAFLPEDGPRTGVREFLGLKEA